MKKFRFTFLIVLLIMIMGCMSAFAAEFAINYNNSPFNVTDSENAGFTVSISETSYTGTRYVIEYYVSGISGTENVRTSYGKNSFDVKIQGLKNGVHSLYACVKKTNGSVMAELNTKIGVVDSYTKRPLEKFSRISMCTHMIFDNQTDKKEIEFLNKIGVFKNRDEIYWGTVEYNGVWNFTKPDAFMNILNDNGMDTVIILDYSNEKYVVTDKFGNVADSKTAPRTAEEMEAFTRYVKEVLTRYPQIKKVEIWNEPNWGFWQPEPSAVDYSAMVKAVSTAARAVREDIYVMCGSLVYSGHRNFLNEMIEEGVLPYVDAISSHPYSFPYGADAVLEDKLNEIDGIISHSGGFKEHIATEIGLPTSTGARGSTEEVQASELVKSFVYGDDGGASLTSWYNFRNKGTDAAEEEHNYGLIRRDYSPKNGVIALANFTQNLNGSIYFGSFELEAGLNAYLYLQDGSITAVVWSKNGEKTVNLDAAYVEDIYGNVTEKKVSSEPIYLFDVNSGILKESLREELEKIYSDAESVWLEKANQDLSAEDVRGIINEHITEGNKVIDTLYKIDRLAAMNKINLYRKSLEKWAAMYGALGGEKTEAVLPEISVKTEKNPDTSAVLKYVKRNKSALMVAENSEDFSGKENAVAYYSALVSVYSAWAEKLYSVENGKTVTNVFLYNEPYMVNVEKGKNAELTVTAINNEDKTVNCRVTVKDENGNTVATSEEVTLLASEKKVFPISWVVPGYKDDGNKKYYICAENGSDVISKRGVNVNITSNTRIYGSFEALKFEDYEKLSITDKHSSIQYIENGEGVNSVHSGSGALYINGNGAIKISVSETDSEIKPADGDLIDGEYYIKVMEQTPTDWKQPIIRLYGILGAEKMLLCETENLNTYSVWNTKRFEWNRLTLKSTGIPYCEGMELVCEIIVGIGANGGLKFMLDDISYFSSYNEKDDGYQTAYGVPKINKCNVFDGGFESTPNGTVPGAWGVYTPGDAGSSHEISNDTVYEKNTSIKISRGGSMWNIIKDISTFEGKNVGGYYMLYVPEGAELKYNYPRVWVECVYNDTTYVVAKSPKHVSEYQLKTGWNKIPIVCTGIKIPGGATRVNLMLESPNIIENGVVNRVYNAPYYIDDINIGEISSGIYFSDNSSLEDGSVNVVLTSTRDYERTEGQLVAASYSDGRLVSCDIKHISMRGMSAKKQQSILINMSIANGADKIKTFFLESDMMIPICNVYEF